jgi:hypothetical protein
MTTQDIISILSISATIVIGVRSFFWSKDYKEAKQAQLDLKDERISFFEMIVDPKYVDKVKNIISEHKSNIKKLQETIQQLKDQLSEANDQIEALKEEISGLSISDSERNTLRVFTTGSSTAMGSLFETANDMTTVTGEIEKSTFDPKMFPSRINLNDILGARAGYTDPLIKKPNEIQDDESPSGVEE